jgi:signal transduction histidine kinase
MDISTLFGSTDGSLWIGLRNGLLRWKYGTTKSYPELSGYVNNIRESHDGSIWITLSRTSTGPLCRLAVESLSCFGKSQAIPFTYATFSADMPSGVLISSGDDLGIWNLHSFTAIRHPMLKPATGLSSIEDIAVNTDGTFWLGMNRGGRHLGLQKYSNGYWSSLHVGGFDSSKLSISKLLSDSHGILWVGTEDDGLYRIDGSDIEHFGRAEGLSGNSINDIFLDHEGDLWVATTEGIDEFHDLKVLIYSTVQGMRADHVSAVSVSSSGLVAVSNQIGIDLLSPGPLQKAGRLEGIPSGHISSILYDDLRRLWAGIDDDLYVIDGHRSKKISTSDGTKLGVIDQLVEDRDRTLWVLSHDRSRTWHLFHIDDERVVRQITLQGPLSHVHRIAAGTHHDVYLGGDDGSILRLDQTGVTKLSDPVDYAHRISDLLVAKDGSVQAATPSGIRIIENGTNRILSVAEGLPCNTIWSMVQAKNDDLFLYADCGIVWIRADELFRFRHNLNYKINARQFDTLDGAFPAASTFSPRGVVGPNGLIYFVNEQVLQVFNPSRYAQNPLSPPVRIERVTGDRGSLLKNGVTVFPSQTRSIEIDYVGLSFVAPQKVRFRYKLEKWDKEWQDVDNRRQAFYTNLPPGDYTFRVLASNNDGIWNEQGASEQLVIKPGLYQSTWFRFIALLLTVAVVYTLFALRLLILTARIREGWTARLSERERIARELHDTFLQGIQGLLLRFNSAVRTLPPETTSRIVLEEALNQADEEMLRGRKLVQDLRNTARTLTLGHELEVIGREFLGLFPIAFSVRSQGRNRPLIPLVAEELSKVGREAISNAFRHAGGSEIQVELNYSLQDLRLTVRDNGRGIDDFILVEGRKAGHWGLPGMRERIARLGGAIRFESNPDTGTSVEIRLTANRAFQHRQWRLTTCSRLFTERRENR